MPAATATSAFAAAEATARSRWAAWAATLADGGDPPLPLELLEAGALLRVDHPAAALEADADAIREVRQLEAWADAGRIHTEQLLAPYGGERGVQERIAELKAELAKLEEIGNPWRHLSHSHYAGQAKQLRHKHARAFPPETEKQKSKPAARGRTKPQEIPS